VLTLNLSTTQAQTTETPTVVVVGSGSVEVDPDYALLAIGVRTQDASPVTASREMSARIDAVVDTLVALGFPRDSLPSRTFDLQAVRDYQNGNRLAGYTAHASLEVRSSELDQLANIIGAALEAGATEMGRIIFGSTKREEARQQALTKAVAAARIDAETIAGASGQSLGSLQKMVGGRSIQVEYERPLIQRTQLMEQIPPNLSPSVLIPKRITVSQSVTATWALASVTEGNN